METKQLAPAKVNLSLRVLGRLPDGYHEIETVFLPIELFDEVYVRRTDTSKIHFETNVSDLPSDEENLCVRAALRFAELVPDFSGCNIHLHKNIPIGAGLGGGSSDAASTLMALNYLFKMPLSRDELFRIAASIGADVPFFLHPGLAIGRNKGEQLEYVPRTFDFWVLIVYPNLKISTSWAYSQLKIGLTNEKKNSILKGQILRGIQLDVFTEFFENDFEKIVFPVYPKLAVLKRQILDAGAIFASLSGTGSCVFGVFTDRGKADAAKKMIKDDLDTFLVKPLRAHSEKVVGVYY